MFDDAEKMDAALATFGVPKAPKETTRQWIQRIRATTGRPNSPFRGLGGGASYAALAGAEVALSGGPEFGRAVTASVTGQILNFSPERINHPKAAGMPKPQRGYFYDQRNGAVRLWLKLVHTFEYATPAGTVQSETFNELYRIDGDPLTLEFRDTSSATNLFPHAAAATDIRVTSGIGDAVTAMLYAKGTRVRVKYYYVDRMAADADRPVRWRRPSSLIWTDVTADDHRNCIEMMFKTESTATPPPTTLPPSSTDTPPIYSLGRCGQPPIISTW
jgi:hypothetical protein